MCRLHWGLRFLTLLCIFQEILLEVDTARVRVVKVKKTRHDKRQTQRVYSDVGQDDYNSPSTVVLRPEDNPYNAGNRKVDYPLLSNDQNNNNNQFNSNQNQNQYSQNQNRNFQGQQQQFNQAQAQAQRQLPPSSSGGTKRYDGSDEHCEGCGNGIPGEAGTDYPTYTNLPKTNFDCKKQQWPGYYADVDARCQVFWICQKNRADAFLCPNGTLFNQQVFVCDWWFNVDCGTATEYYSRNQYIYAGAGVDLFGNQIPINNRKSTAVDGVNNVGSSQNNPNLSRSRPPTNRPPINFQQQTIEHAPTTVIPIPFTSNNQQEPFHNPRQTGFQIPIVQTTTENYITPTQQAPPHYNRRATEHFSPSNTVGGTSNGQYTATRAQLFPSNQASSSSHDPGSGYLPQNGNNRGYSRSPPGNSNGGYSRSTPTSNNGGYNNQNNFNTDSANNAGNSDSDGGSSYANYIDAQKRLHLGSNYKPKGSGSKSYLQNPLLTSTTSRSTQDQQQQTHYQEHNYSIKTSQYNQAPPPLQRQQSSYPTQGNTARGGYQNGAYSTTTKRNAISLEDLDESSSNVGTARDDEETFDDDGLEFSFAKTVVPTTTLAPPPPQVVHRPTEIIKFRKQSVHPNPTKAVSTTTTTTTTAASNGLLLPVTTHRPFSRHGLKNPKKVNSAALAKNLSQSLTNNGISVPLTYIQVPPLTDQSEAPQLPTTTSPSPTFGRKIKSGKKRNTSNWTNYFHKN